jgi:hypothetical protein
MVAWAAVRPVDILMWKVYEDWLIRWENRLCFRATNRVVRPFDWGLEWTSQWPLAKAIHQNGHAPETYLRCLNQAAIEHSDEFYSYRSPSDFRLVNGNILRFSSPIRTPFPANNIVHGQWFPARKQDNRAVVILPHWNATHDQHVALCRGIARFGISALRVSLPYHDFRMPAELRRADFAVSSNIGRTLDAARQAVIDVRCAFDWLQSQGYERLGIVGTSLGSCYACLASAHDPRIRVNVFNHCSTYFADVVWTGLSTLHVRQGLEGNIDLPRLREAWQAISPVNFLARYATMPKKSLFIYSRYDTTFLPRLSQDIVAEAARLGIDHRVVVMPCGHYTLGETPFKYIDGYHICSFLMRNL